MPARAHKRNLFGFGRSGRPDTTPAVYRGRPSLPPPIRSSAATPKGGAMKYKGAVIHPTEGGYYIGRDKDSVFDTVEDAKRFIRSAPSLVLRNPAASAEQYGLALAVASGRARSSDMPKSVAKEIIRQTPPAMRSKFATELAAKRANPVSPITGKVVYGPKEEVAQLRTNAQEIADKNVTAVVLADYDGNVMGVVKPNPCRCGNPAHRRNVETTYHPEDEGKVKPVVLRAKDKLWYVYAYAGRDALGRFVRRPVSPGYKTRHSALKAVKRNPSDLDLTPEEQDAAILYETFHGKAADRVIEVTEEHRERDTLATVGPLVELKVATITGLDCTLSFDWEGEEPIRLGSSPDGTQLYFVGGDQKLDLSQFKMDGKKWERDHMVIGVLYQLTYETQKRFDKFVLTDYFHDLGERKEGSETQPMLNYDTLNKRFSVVGGNYHLKADGIIG